MINENKVLFKSFKFGLLTHSSHKVKGIKAKRSEMSYIASQEVKRREALQATIRAEARSEVKPAKKLNKASKKCIGI